MGQRLGMAGVLVLSGATSVNDLSAGPVRPDYVITDLSQLLPPTPAPMDPEEPR
jgi:ribonucleotide monophosphatase NagD (HAD superfamily)